MLCRVTQNRWRVLTNVVHWRRAIQPSHLLSCPSPLPSIFPSIRVFSALHIRWPKYWSWLLRKDPNDGKDWRQEEKGMAEDKMVGWHHWLDRHEFERALGVGDGQGSLTCCSPWGRKESDTTERFNWTSGTSLMVQWLSVCLPVQGTWVQSLVREVRSHMLHSMANPPSKNKQTKQLTFLLCFQTFKFPMHFEVFFFFFFFN